MLRRLALVAVVACHRPVPAPAPRPPAHGAAAAVPIDARIADADEPDAPPDDGPDEESLADEFPAAKQAIGPLRIGLTAPQVMRLLGKPKTRSEPVQMGATGEYASEWDYGGALLQMFAATSKGPYHLGAISVAAPSQLRTPEGIGIGATRAEIVAVYGRYLGHTTDPNQVLVGSIYFGLLFTLDHDRVVAIFLGAMAF